ncbi:sensor histidine kinase [Brumimicrobium mesophilum]|uniref:sensor histidine kinase n=1 Tax=Brumimicrobium mesophilum TaxID=392717 RepID=UPI000D143EA8|nr:histidine kinase [Brumimicrobium mesophilum]
MGKHKLLYWIVQFVAWGILCGIIGIAAYIQGEFNFQTSLKLIELYVLLIFFSNLIRWVFIKRNWFNLKLKLLVPRVVAMSFILSALLMFITNASNSIFNGDEWLSFSEFLVNTLLYSLFLIMWSAVYLTYHLLQKSRLQEIYNLKLQASQTQNELKTLRDQLNPHFLFNSLNSIRALIAIEPLTAKAAITTLSSLLRSSLILGKKSFISLSEELQLVEEYLKLEKIRYEERLVYSLKCKLPNAIQIPPFLIQSMVENAIKHGISKKMKGGQINVSVFYLGENLIMEVINDGEFNENNNVGIGIKNTKRRLEIIYGNKAGFEIKNIENKVHTSIWINKIELTEKHYESSIN